jgi:flavin reductase (DIM6/NTAB) family NADH-FMN oxidoreductase RutF
MTDTDRADLVALDVAAPVWDRFFTVAPLVLVATRNADGSHNVAPKHMALQLGWDNYYGFVCSPGHHTYQNVVARPQFTVSFPRPDQVLLATFAAGPRWADDSKPGLLAVPTLPAAAIDGVLVADCYAYLECELDRIVGPFGGNSLIAGRVLAARVAEDALRSFDGDDGDLVDQAPLLAYLHPGRFATIAKSQTFPFAAGFSR